MKVIHGFKAIAYSSTERPGVIPFRVEAERNATDVAQISDISERVQLAQTVNRALTTYQGMASYAVGQNGRYEDRNADSNKVRIRETISGGKAYSVYAEFIPKATGVDQPIEEAQVRWTGAAAGSPNHFTMTRESVEMLDPITQQPITLTHGENGTISIELF